jgi:2-polyprenyl-3-methyl-5-hydroxy-6-metoxy-1,4-benzoquinol methylase
MSEINVYDLTYKSFGKFDIIIFPGVLYHLRYPFWALKVIREVLNEGGYLITETPIWRAEKKNAILFCPIEGASPYEPTSCTFFNEKGMVDTLKSIGFKTINIEYVPVAHPIKRAIRNFKAYLRTVLARGNRPPIRRVERCAFLSQYLGVDMNSEIMKYWEDIHKIHSGGHV